MRVLIAEDDPVSRRLLETLLRKWNYEVLVASNGREAYDILKSADAPRMAILDWMMPEMDGIELCRLVREQAGGEYKYLILLTAKDRKEDAAFGMNAGADDYIVKPFDANELNARLRAGCRIVDLQAELVSAQESLLIQATCDPLTGLPNRLLFSDRLTQQLAQAKRHQASLAVVFLDLDGFKIINDTLGHDIGDLLLKGVGKRLIKALRNVDTVARMGGDEFTIIVPDIRNADDAAVAANKILNVLNEPFQLENHELFVCASLGISLYPMHGDTAEVLVRNADTAMYRAKEHGRHSFRVFTESLNAAAIERITLERSLRKAIGTREMFLHYQPMVDIFTGQIRGVEALARWKNQRLGSVPPSQFIPLAEETGLIVSLGQWTIQTACAQVRAWEDAGLGPITVSVNLSAC